MLPNFLIIGAQKAATTWLAACLSEHPDVFIAEEKEIYFFNVHFDRGLDWYEAYFSDWSGQVAIGEATPGYISHPDAPERIRATLGDVKLIASLRHPVDRAYSAFWHYLRAGRIPPDTDFCTFFRQNDQFEIHSRGYYFAQLNRYLKYFSRENLLVLIYEEIFQDSQRAVTNCLKFLGMDPQFEPSALTVKVNRGGRDIGIFHSQALALRPTLRRALLRTANIRLLPRSLRKLLFAVGRRAFEKLAFEGGAKKRHFERLGDDLRQEFLSDYMSDIRQLEGLLDRDLSIWYELSRA